jgi:hypothetical protein
MTSSIEEMRRQMLEEKARQSAQPSPADRSKTPEIAVGVIGDTLIGGPALHSTDAPSAHNAAAVPAASVIEDGTPPVMATPVVPVVTRRSSSVSAPTFVRFAKVCISLTILLAGCYFTVKTAYPLLRELAKPGSVAASPDAPAGVKILQQTRSVVAKNNANVDNLNHLINDTLGEGYAAAATTPIPPLPAPPPQLKSKPPVQVRLEKLSHVVIDELHVSSVLGGATPHITIDGLIVGIGGIVDHKRRLRFVSLDEAKRVIVLGNGQETIEKPY